MNPGVTLLSRCSRSPTPMPSASDTRSEMATGTGPSDGPPSAGQAPATSEACNFDALGEAEDRKVSARPSPSARARRTIGAADPDDRSRDRRERVVERRRHRRIETREAVRRHPRDGLEVDVGRRRIGQRPVEAGQRDGAAVHHTGRQEARGERAHDAGREHDRPVGARAAEAHPEQCAERRDHLRRLPGRRWGRSPGSIPRLGRTGRAVAGRHPACIRILHTGRMSVGTAFHPRTSPLNRKMQWREWSGYFASSVYADAHDIEYNAIREAAALIDVSPLYKYLVSGPDALRLVDRVVTRDATKLSVGGVIYTPWCDEHGKVVDDGTDPSPRRAPLPLDRRRPSAPLAAPEQRRARRDHHRGDGGDRRARAAGPAVARRARGRDRRIVRRPALLPAPRRRRSARSPSTCHGPATRATSATSCGSRPRARSRSGTRSSRRARRTGIRPAGMLALDVVRLEAGLVLHRGRLHLGPPRDEPRAELFAGRDRARPPGQLRQGRLRRPARARARSEGRWP